MENELRLYPIEGPENDVIDYISGKLSDNMKKFDLDINHVNFL